MEEKVYNLSVLKRGNKIHLFIMDLSTSHVKKLQRSIFPFTLAQLIL